MATPNEDWPSGHRHVHHGLQGRESQRAQALVWRDHHTSDEHTHDGDYAALDEAFTRLDLLERPTPARRLHRLRKIAEARAIRRRYNREANWLVHNDEHLHYGRRLELHERYEDQYGHPAADGLILRDEDTARLGPTREDIDIECDARIDEMRPRLSEIIAFREAAKPFPGEPDHVTQLFTTRVAAIERERGRALFLKALNAVADDYFEPHHWTTAKSDALLKHVRASQLGAPEESDRWHELAAGSMSSASEYDDLLAVCQAVAYARTQAATYPIWPDPPADLPDVTVTVTPPAQVAVSWSSAPPQGVTVELTLVQSTNLQAGAAFPITMTETPRNIAFAGSRLALLVQFQRAASRGKAAQRTGGEFKYVGVLIR